MGNIYIAFGANLSNPKETFKAALTLLDSRGVVVREVSGLWQSPSWPPGRGHPDYLNGVAAVDFTGTADVLLTVLMDVEAVLGRERGERNAPRTLDLDILDFKGQILNSERLTLPHPRMLERGFVLFPLDHINPHWTDPVSGQKIIHFIARLRQDDVALMKYVGTFL